MIKHRGKEHTTLDRWVIAKLEQSSTQPSSPVRYDLETTSSSTGAFTNYRIPSSEILGNQATSSKQFYLIEYVRVFPTAMLR